MREIKVDEIIEAVDRKCTKHLAGRQKLTAKRCYARWVSLLQNADQRNKDTNDIQLVLFGRFKRDTTNFVPIRHNGQDMEALRFRNQWVEDDGSTLKSWSHVQKNHVQLPGCYGVLLTEYNSCFSGRLNVHTRQETWFREEKSSFTYLKKWVNCGI